MQIPEDDVHMNRSSGAGGSFGHLPQQCRGKGLRPENADRTGSARMQPASVFKIPVSVRQMPPSGRISMMYAFSKSLYHTQIAKQVVTLHLRFSLQHCNKRTKKGQAAGYRLPVHRIRSNDRSKAVSDQIPLGFRMIITRSGLAGRGCGRPDRLHKR